MSLLIKNARLITPGIDAEGVAVLVEGKLIADVFYASEELPKADECYDAAGNMLMHGFIDMHCHGGMSYETTSLKAEAMPTIAEAKMKEGVTSFCPTTLTLSQEQLESSLALIEQYRRTPKYTKVIGTHLEGPYVNPKCAGAQNPAYLRNPNIAEVRRLNAISPVSLMTYAVELDGAVPFTSQLCNEGIIPSCGHTNATKAQFMAAKAKGLSRLTHFCNQMTKLHHREIGMVGTGLLDDDVYVEMICDKIHLCPDMIALAFKVKPIERIILITDAMEATGLPDGDYQIGGLAVVVRDGAARLKENIDALAGSTLQFNRALKNVHEITGIPLKELVRTTSLNQAQEMHINDLGKIAPGYVADMALLDKDFNVKAVFIDGSLKR